MKTYLILSVFILGLVSCNLNSETDSTGETKIDEIIEHELDLSALRKEYIENYDLRKNFKDTVVSNNDIFYLEASYYCSFDSAVDLPTKYVWENDSTFITHNYLLQLFIKKNQQAILDDTISKAIFQDVLPPEFNDYAVLMFPDYSGYDEKSERFEFVFSLTIPITDLGQGKSLFIDRDGKLIVE